MSNQIYVGNMNYQMTSDSLKELFADFGEVRSATIITDRETGRSKGFGFVEMGEIHTVRKAIDELNNKEVMGRRLRVNEARPKNY